MAKVSVYDRGFLYGDSIFETIRTYAGEPFALDEHLCRLEGSAARVAIDLPVTRAVFAQEIRLAIRAARNDESTARAMVTRGSGPVGLDPALATAPLRVVLIEPLVMPPAILYRDGVAAILTKVERASDAAHGAKVGNYLASLLALKQARAANAHEALILDQRDNITEGTTSNVFVVKGGVVITPPEGAGILLGITRRHVIEVARARRVEVREAAISRDELFAADEIFLTSSIREILPVVRVDGNVIGSGAPGAMTRAIHTSFRAQVGLGSARMPWEPAVSKTLID
jgi:branched-chain amino acid aminotransferase